jgi:hypothetical protein
MKRLTLVIAAGFLTLAAAPTFAHEEMRVIGTVSKQNAASIEVKLKDGTTSLIGLDGSTTITRDKQKVAASELKVGTNVVVDGLGDDTSALQGLEVRIVPAAAK